MIFLSLDTICTSLQSYELITQYIRTYIHTIEYMSAQIQAVTFKSEKGRGTRTLKFCGEMFMLSTSDASAPPSVRALYSPVLQRFCVEWGNVLVQEGWGGRKN